MLKESFVDSSTSRHHTCRTGASGPILSFLSLTEMSVVPPILNGFLSEYGKRSLSVVNGFSFRATHPLKMVLQQVIAIQFQSSATLLTSFLKRKDTRRKLRKNPVLIFLQYVQILRNNSSYLASVSR